MSKIKKHNNTVPKKIQEPIGTRIAKAVYEEQKKKEKEEANKEANKEEPVLEDDDLHLDEFFK